MESVLLVVFPLLSYVYVAAEVEVSSFEAL